MPYRSSSQNSQRFVVISRSANLSLTVLLNQIIFEDIIKVELNVHVVYILTRS